MFDPKPKEQPLEVNENQTLGAERLEETSPLQWPKAKRIGHVILVSILTLVMYDFLTVSCSLSVFD